MIPALLVAQLTIIASGPPLKPADAAATLRRASPDFDLSKRLFPLDELPFVINLSPPSVARRAPGELVPLVAVPPRPAPPSITFKIPRQHHHGWKR
jgi:hypothetical protein